MPDLHENKLKFLEEMSNKIRQDIIEMYSLTIAEILVYGNNI